MATAKQASATRHAGQAIPWLAEQIARVHDRHLGRAPRHVRLHLFDDLLVAVLKGCATPIETVLREQGRTALLAEIREATLPAIEHELRAAVESSLLRGVTACMSAVDTESDIVTLMFSLDEEDQDLRGRALRSRRHSDALQSDSRALRAQSEQALKHASEIIEKRLP